MMRTTIFRHAPLLLLAAAMAAVAVFLVNDGPDLTVGSTVFEM